jgi:hypothetical protein
MWRMHPILQARVGHPQDSIGLLPVSQYVAPSEAVFTLTNSLVFTQTNQPEADGEHAGMGKYRD